MVRHFGILWFWNCGIESTRDKEKAKEMFKVEEIRSKEQFRGLHTIWQNLLEKSEKHSPFLTHEWFWCCLLAYSKNKELFILVLRNGTEVVGIAPLWLYKDVVRGVKVEKIGFVTCPDTPFVDFIVQKEKQRKIIKAILDYLYVTRKGLWDILTLNQWCVKSSNYTALKEVTRGRGKNIFSGFPSTTPYIPMTVDWETFLQTRSVKFRKTHRNINNRISKLKKVEIQCFRQDTSGTLFKQILSVSEKGWKHKKGIAISSREEGKLFFDTLTEIASKKGWLLTWLLMVNEIPIAMEYDLVYQRRVYALRSDFNEDYKEYSPGAYLEYQIIKYLFEEGYLEYNTGPGLNTYKLHWTEQMKENGDIHICNNNFKGLIIWILEGKLFPFLRWVKEIKKKIISNRG